MLLNPDESETVEPSSRQLVTFLENPDRSVGSRSCLGNRRRRRHILQRAAGGISRAGQFPAGTFGHAACSEDQLLTMLRLGSRRRTVLSQTVRELANIVVGALVVGQLVEGGVPSVASILGGIGAWFLLVGLAMLFVGETNGD